MIIDGRELARAHQSKLKKLKSSPKVVSILVGTDASSVLYSDIKQKKATELGIEFEIRQLPVTAEYPDLENEIQALNKDKAISGIMVQLPLPRKFLGERDQNDILKLINPKKDVDGLSPKSKVLPAAVRAILSIIKDEKITVKKSLVTIIGNADGIGRILSKELTKLGGKVYISDVADKDLREKTLEADILISAKGIAGLVIGRMVKEGAVVIDMGISSLGGKVEGDVDFESVSPKASKITPVPGGVGPMTVISLMENIIDLVR
jgi:methylenetetrahydrofolate dehydrogenase (NADP+) / methenyltetrahydrofolate cyclohydrolase